MLAYRARLLAFATDFNLVGNEHSGNHGHAGRPGEVGGSAPAATSVTTGKDVERHMAPALASAAQAVYDEWDENEDVYAGGGICHIIAEEMAGKLIEKGIEATTVSNQIGEQHVWVVAKLDDGVYSIDIPPGTYETGGGYSWKKRQGVEITKDDVIVDRIDRDPSKFEDYLDMSFQLGGEGSGNFDHAGRPGQVGGSSKSVHDTLPIRGTKEQIEALVQRYGFTVTKITRDHAAGEDWHAVEVEGDDRTQLDLLTEATETPTQADKPPRRPIFKSPREKARIAAEARRREGGAVGHAQRERDWRMQRGRDQQRIIRAIRKRDAEGKSLFSQALDAILLEGNEHSGNYGHAGRPGQVGGSASGPAAGTHIANSKEQIDRGHYLQEANHHIARSELTPELEEAFNWASKNPATPILTMDSTVTFRPLGKTPLRWTASNGVEIVKAFDAGGSFHDYNPKNEMAVPLNVEKPRSEYGDADSEYAEMDEDDYQRENEGKHTVEAATAALEEWSRKFVIPIAQARWEAKQARGLSYDIPDVLLLGGEGSGNFDHAGRPGEVGGSGPGGEHASIINTFRAKLRPADSYNSTHFILPDGTRLSHSEDTHWGAAEKLGIDLGKALQAGVLRYNVGGGGEIGHPITEQQAQHLIDGHLFSGGNQPLHVDVFIGSRQASKTFDPDRDTADTIRHWVNDKFSGVPLLAQAGRKAPIAVGRRIAASDDWKQQLLDLFVEALNLGGEGSGNFGHAGRIGEVGGSGPGGTTVRETLTDADKAYVDAHSSWGAANVVAVADRADGTKVIFPKTFGTRKVPTAEQQAEVFGTRDPRALLMQMSEALSGNVTAYVRVGQNAQHPDATVIDFNIIADGEGEHVKVSRQFIREKDGTLVVHEDTIEVRYAPGKGIAKALMADSMRIYKTMGVEKVTLIANLDVGGYAWAKYGFKADRPQSLADTLSQRVTDGRVMYGTEPGPTILQSATPAEKAGLQAVIDQHKDDPKLPWHIANTVTTDGVMIGKQVLLESYWHASLDLGDREAMKKFNAYVKPGRTKPKVMPVGGVY